MPSTSSSTSSEDRPRANVRQMSSDEMRSVLVRALSQMSPTLHAAYLCAKVKKTFEPLSESVPWSPGELSLIEVLVGAVRPCVLAIQIAADPSFRLSDFPLLSPQDRDILHRAMADVLYMLVRPFSPPSTLLI